MVSPAAEEAQRLCGFSCGAGCSGQLALLLQRPCGLARADCTFRAERVWSSGYDVRLTRERS